MLNVRQSMPPPGHHTTYFTYYNIVNCIHEYWLNTQNTSNTSTENFVMVSAIHSFSVGKNDKEKERERESRRDKGSHRTICQCNCNCNYELIIFDRIIIATNVNTTPTRNQKKKP